MSILFLNKTAPSFKITENFSSSEIINASHTENDIVLIDKKVVEVAQYIRTALSVPLTVTSANRSKTYNAGIAGSSKNSQHIGGRALDLKGTGLLEFMLKSYEEKNEHWQAMYNLGLRGLGFYDWGVHIDTRESIRVANWDYRLKKKVLTGSLWGLLIFILIWITGKRFL